MTHQEILDLIEKLDQPFPPEDYKERPLPGGDRWFYVPWQKYRERLDAVCIWQDSYSNFSYPGDRCVVICTIKIGGYKRQGVGSVPLVEYSTSGKECSRGTPEERAIADAFKHACEQWGLCRHIDNQRYLAQYLRQYHDGRPVAYARKNQNQYTMPRPQKQSPGRGNGQISREEWIKLQRSN
jgi:hypothetical protein